MSHEHQKECLVCKATSNEMPLISFEYKGKQYEICSAHIPILIHKAQDLRSILPDIKDSEE